MRSMSRRRGTEKLQVGILQLATVKPQPHWQVKPSETCALVGVSAANISRETFFSSGMRKTNSTATSANMKNLTPNPFPSGKGNKKVRRPFAHGKGDRTAG